MDRLFQDYLQGLSKYLNPNEILNTSPVGKVYDAVCVIPLAGEYDTFLNKTLPSIYNSAKHTQNSVLLVAVVNSSPERSGLALKETNLKLLNHFQMKSGQAFKWLNPYPELDICVLNFENGRYSFGPKEGVGLARKIGTDLGLFFISQDRAKWNFIYNTDGDAQVPLNYFLKPSREIIDKFGARVYPFRHIPDSQNPASQNKAGIFYDYYLRYFYEGMKFSKSHFCYIPIGSCLLLNPLRYAQARGFPNRLAGEDFYILSKITKLSQVDNLEAGSDDYIKLESRLSDRVPFGTGATLTEWTPLIENEQESLVGAENPNTFYALKKTLEYLRSLSFSKEYFSMKAYFHSISEPDGELLQDLLEKVFQPELAYQALKKQFQPGSDFAKRFTQDNFDYLKQLRFIHELSQSEQDKFQKIAMSKLIDRLPNAHFVDPIGNGLSL